MTANAMTGDRERCLEAGMDGYVAKPIKPATMFAVLEELVAKAADDGMTPAGTTASVAGGP